MNAEILPLSGAFDRKLQRLIDISHNDHMDLRTVVEWSKGVDRSRYPKRVDHCWLFGTPYWDAMDEGQRLEMAWQENARDVAMFIWLEQTLPPLYVSYVVQHDDKLLASVREYLMVFSKEEIVHTLLFRRYMALAGLSLFVPPAGLNNFFAKELHEMPPVVGVLCTYLLEQVAEIGAINGTDGPGIDSLTREMYVAHHQEEVRHLAFGRWVVESHLESAPQGTAREMAKLVEPFMSRLVAQFTFNPEIANRVEVGFKADDVAAVDRVRRSANNARINEERFGPMLRWLKKCSLVHSDYQWY